MFRDHFSTPFTRLDKARDDQQKSFKPIDMDLDIDFTISALPPMMHHGGRTGAPGSFADVSANRINGSDRSETITGTENRDVIKAGRGDDIVNAGDGNDTVFGEKGNDTINGGNGNDYLSGGPGNDVLYAGDDGWLNILNGGPGRDTMWGATFENVIDVFQFTEDTDAAPSLNPDAVDRIYDFRDGEDLIHLAFDANPFMPGDQEFIFVQQDDAGTAGTIWFDTLNGGSSGGEGWIDVMIHGHTDNDGIADFSIRVGVLVDEALIDPHAADAAYQALGADDFLFG